MGKFVGPVPPFPLGTRRKVENQNDSSIKFYFNYIILTLIWWAKGHDLYFLRIHMDEVWVDIHITVYKCKVLIIMDLE